MIKLLPLFILSAVLLSCGDSTATNTAKSAVPSTSVSKSVNTAKILKIYSFHTQKRCYTCNQIEKLTREVVEELANDRIKLEVVNISQKGSEALAEKYEVAWSSLVLDNGGRVVNLTQIAFSLAKNQPEKFKEVLREQIAKML